MDTGTFMDIVGVHYKDIKSLFISRDVKKGLQFNEDSFNTAFIKCVEQFGNKPITYDDVLKYFYVTYKTVRCNELKYYSKTDVCDEFTDDFIEDDKSYAESLYEDVMNEITKRFGEEDMMIYSLHKYHDWSIEDLEDDGYDCVDFEERITTIHRFIKKYCKKMRGR